MPKALTSATFWAVVMFAGLTAATAVVLWALEEPWTARDWATNIIFALGIAALTGILTRPQAQLQRALADSEVIEKVSAVEGFADKFRQDVGSSQLLQLMLDMQSGLVLYPLASHDRQAQFLRASATALASVSEQIESRETAHTYWRQQRWHAVSQTADETLEAFREYVGERAFNRAGPGPEIRKHLTRLHKNSGRDAEVDLKLLERWYGAKGGPRVVGSRLNWSALGGGKGKSRATVKVLRHKSQQFLSKRKVYPAWYFDGKGKLVEHDGHGARPVLFDDVDTWFEHLPDFYKRRIYRLQDGYTTQDRGTVPTLVLVTLDLDDDRLLVLDGNNRMAAIYLERPDWPEIRVRIVEYRISGPLTEDVLPDLRLFT